VIPPRDALELLVVANDEFAGRLRLVGPGDWRRPTPCSEWDVRALVNHVVGANIRYQLLLHGAPTEEVEATRTVDHLGDDALASFIMTANAVVACFHEDGALDRVGHHLIGDRTGRELLSMRVLDVAVHGWDLGRAIGADETISGDLVTFLLDYTAELYPDPRDDAFAQPDGGIPPEAAAQDQLLRRLGRSPNVTEDVR
jgi:uncharacterized protein (TIGR03086 family)